jgi:3-deoxy-manno-octulosonate cytidylyltransferase (CMP-KDO synthetase)
VHPVSVTRWPFTLTESSVLAVIPARYASTRFPGKVLADLAGHPLIEHVYRRTAGASRLSGVVVATDDARVAEAVRRFGGVAVMTRADHPSGTDRLAEVAAGVPCRIIVNVQGDEPLIEPAAIDAAVAPLLADASVEMTTLSRPFADAAEFASPHVVKVITDAAGDALYFSRAAIPYPQTGPAVPSAARAHTGLYAYRRDVLLRLAALRPTQLETTESLEQLRAIEHGIRIRVIDTPYTSVHVDTPGDLDRVRQVLMVHRT